MKKSRKNYYECDDVIKDVIDVFDSKGKICLSCRHWRGYFQQQTGDCGWRYVKFKGKGCFEESEEAQENRIIQRSW